MHTLDFIHQLSYDDLPDDVIGMARTCLLDLIGVAAAGSQTVASNIMVDYVSEEMAGNSPIPFTNKTASRSGAALAIGTMIDSFDAHDGQVLCKGHVGAGIFPAIYSLLGNPLNADSELGKEIIVNTVIGYELGTRLGIALHSTVSDYHTSGAWNGVAAAAIGARALGLDNKQTEHALGIAEYHGPRSQMMRCIDYPTMLKDGSGMGAMVGVSAALLAQKGFTGAPAITAFSHQTSALFADLGQRWYTLEQYFKLYPVCRWAQPAIEAVLALRAAHDFSPEQIKSIQIHSFLEAVRLGKKHPQSSEEAQYGLAFPFACALLFGDINVHHITEDLADNNIAQIIDKISLHDKDEFNAVFPAERWAEVTITLTDGSVLKSPPTRTKGDFDNPYSPQILQQKAEKLLALQLSGAAVQQTIKQLKTLGEER